jgi:hypothetical protein
MIHENPCSFDVYRRAVAEDSSGSQYRGAAAIIGTYIGRLTVAPVHDVESHETETTVSTVYRYYGLFGADADIQAGDELAATGIKFEASETYPAIVKGVHTHTNVTLKRVD